MKRAPLTAIRSELGARIQRVSAIVAELEDEDAADELDWQEGRLAAYQDALGLLEGRNGPSETLLGVALPSKWRER